ncbi:hypothetical protein vseg_007237 [Gypsophila vaccaria]
MDVATLLTMAQTLLQLIDCLPVTKLVSVSQFSSRLSKLKDTMTSITAVLLDAEESERQQVDRSHVEHDWLEKLKDAVYDVDDILDEVASVAQMQRLMPGFFSRVNQLVFGLRMLKEIEKIRGRLDCIAKDHRDFGSKTVGSFGGGGGGRTLLRRREESHSFVRDEDVIGRDMDKEEVVQMLLDRGHGGDENDVRFVTVVGIGGLGKTTLAQLVYNDERIESEFRLKLWVCVSDEFEMKSLVCKLLMSITNQRPDDLEMDQLCRLIREKIDGERYLLVLDDVWCEDRDQWLKLREILILIGGKKGGVVLVTTRSKEVGRMNGRMYELEGLSEEASWHLFEKMSSQDDMLGTNMELIEIGKQIIAKCANVPLAIRVVGALLYGQSKAIWSSFSKTGLANIKQDDKNSVMAILKLSYHRLAPPLKSCFSYCALFPKDYEVNKEVLISLWMAQGFIVPLDGQNVEDAGEEYFTTLVQRCFFQAVEYDVYGEEIVSCKLHDLMHDLAQEVAGADISSRLILPNGKTRHLAIDDVDVATTLSCLSGGERLRTIFRLHGHVDPSLGKLSLTKMKRLRVLDLHATGVKILRGSIGGLVHLRYLDLSDNKELEILPSTFSKLVNLQMLNLERCERLRELPRDIRNLTNLRQLDIYGCHGLTYMPPGMNNLAHLQRLSMFVIAEARYRSSLNRDCAGELEDLEALANLRGSLVIKIRQDSVIDVPTVRNGKILSRLEHIKCLDIIFECWGATASDQADNNGNIGIEELLVNLKPHPNLKTFRMERYQGMMFPLWAMSEDLAATLPNLVELCLGGCQRLKHLPLLNNLRHLRALKLYRLDDLEYVQNSTECNDDGEIAAFPCLETLRLWGLPSLKGWWRFSAASIQRQEISLCPTQSFPRLFDMRIRGCPNLATIPLCTNLESLTLRSCLSDSSSSSLLVSCYQCHPSELTIVYSCNDVESFPIQKEAWTRLHSTLRSLRLSSCIKLKNLREERLEQLTTLQELQLSNLKSLEEAEDCDLNPWISLRHNLHKLLLSGLPKLITLPQGIQYCTALHTLEISECPSLEALPEWISCLTSLECFKIRQCNSLISLPDAILGLTSLQRLKIEDCRGLTERCRAPNGEDWHKIQHIPHVSVFEIDYGPEDQ